MNKKGKGILWGILLIIVAVLWALDSFDLIRFNLFFKGWWTLFIIVPCVIGLFTERDKTGNLVGLAIGIVLLLCVRDILDFKLVGKLFFPALILFFGISMLCKALLKNENSEKIKELKGKDLRAATAVFGGVEARPDGEVFQGADLTAVFGGVEYDLRGAVFEEDCVINATAIFGGIDIFLPETVNVKRSSNCFFGGVSEEKHHNKAENTVTVYINGTAIFGGVEIK